MDSDQKFTAIKSIHINGKAVRANKFHLGNSQIYYKGRGNISTIGFGQVSEIFLEEVTKKYYLMIKQFKNLYETDHDRGPFKDFPHLQARLFYKELGPLQQVRIQFVLLKSI